MKLYGYWRSSATWRTRIGLAHKGLAYTYVPVNLLLGENNEGPHRERSPLAQVPVLELEDGTQLTQSLAILQFLDSLQASPPIQPGSALDRARAMALAEVVNAGIQPLQNLPMLRAVVNYGGDKMAWGKEVIQRGLEAYTTLAAPHAGLFSVGDAVSIADFTLIPQLYNARRFGCDLEPLGLLTAIEARCEALPAFQAAHPNRMIDAPASNASTLPHRS